MKEQLAGGRVKGGMIRAHLDWVFQQGGEEGIERVLARLPNNVAHEVRNALATTWCSFAAVVHLDRAIAEVYEPQHAAVVRELGRWSAQQNLSTTYRMFRRAGIHDFFKRSTALHSQFQDFGTEDYEPLGDSSARMIHRDYSTYSPTYCDSACGYYEQVMKMHGATRVSVEHPSCLGRGGSMCIFEFRWS
jgi:hypothetical protein